MTWPPSLLNGSSFYLITHNSMFYSLESDCFRGQYIENIILSLLILTSFAVFPIYKIPSPINQCPCLGHMNKSSNIFSCLSMYSNV